MPRKYRSIRSTVTAPTATAECKYGLKNKQSLKSSKTVLRIMQKYSLLSVVRRRSTAITKNVCTDAPIC